MEDQIFDNFKSIWDSDAMQNVTELGGDEIFFQKISACSPQVCMNETNANTNGITPLPTFNLSYFGEEVENLNFPVDIENYGGIGPTGSDYNGNSKALSSSIDSYVSSENRPNSSSNEITATKDIVDNNWFNQIVQNDSTGRKLAFAAEVEWENHKQCLLTIRGSNYGNGTTGWKYGDIQFIVWTTLLDGILAFTDDKKVARDLFLSGVTSFSIRHNKKGIESFIKQRLDFDRLQKKLKSWTQVIEEWGD